MIGIDTNVLLRLFIADDDRSQHERAMRLLHEFATPVLVSPLTLAEATWTLRKSFKQPRSVIAEFVAKTLDVGVFVVPFAAAVARALAGYERGRADFADYLIAEMNIDAGCDRTATFDRDASGHPHYFLVP